MKSRKDDGGAGSALIADLERMKPRDWSMNGWAVAAGVSRAVWGDIKRHGNPSRKTLEKLLSVAGSSLAEFEALRIGSIPAAVSRIDPAGLADRRTEWRAASLPSSPDIGSVGRGEILLGRVRVPVFQLSQPLLAESRPASGGHHRLEVHVFVSNMEPRFRNGRAIAVDRHEPGQVGDDVIIGLHVPDNDDIDLVYLLAHIVGQAGETLTLRQYAPAGDYDLPAANVRVQAKILGEIF